MVSSQWSCISVGNMRIALINQTFYPDVVSTGQHLSDLALHLAARGHEVTVVTSRRAYDDPEKVFPKQETWRGVRIRRVSPPGSASAPNGGAPPTLPVSWARAAGGCSGCPGRM